VGRSLQIFGRRKSLRACDAPKAGARSEPSRLSRRVTAVIGVSSWNVPSYGLCALATMASIGAAHLPCCAAALASAGRNDRIFSVLRRQAREPRARSRQEGRAARRRLIRNYALRSSRSNARTTASRPPTASFTANAISAYPTTLCRCGITGCTRRLVSPAHRASGRRTFVTRCPKNIIAAGGSLRDVQELAGHSSLATTQRYFQGDADAKRRVVDL
jgi:hypothetical protein